MKRKRVQLEVSTGLLEEFGEFYRALFHTKVSGSIHLRNQYRK